MLNRNFDPIVLGGEAERAWRRARGKGGNMGMEDEASIWLCLDT